MKNINSCFILCLLSIFLFFGLHRLNAQSPTVEITVSDDTLQSYTGKYAISPVFILTLTTDGGRLKVSAAGQPAILVFPESQNKFFNKEHPAITMEFIKGADGKVKKVILTQDGRVMEARKLEVSGDFDPEKKYSVDQLKHDFIFLRNTLKKYHPRLYEFIPKPEFDCYLDSLYAAIKEPMNEIEFRYFLMPAIAKIHCGHTSLAASYQLEQYHSSSYQPFILYYEDHKAYIRYCAYPELKSGTEVLEINGESIKNRVNNFLQRVTGDGMHRSVQYWRMNQPMSWTTFEMPAWFNVKVYKLLVVNPDKTKKEITLNAVSEAEFVKRIPPPAKKQHQLKVLDDNSTAILTYPSLDFPNDSIRNSFLNRSFAELKEKSISNLIIDLRGNGGGSPENAAFLLKYLMKEDFIYSNTTSIPNLLNLTQPISVSANRYNGNLYHLIDGGCFSSTGHLLSMIKYYKLGSLIGERSSATYSCNTNGQPHSLPNTDLTLYCPHGTYETAVKGFRRSEGILPDFKVKNNIQDLITGKDRVLKFTLDLIQEKNVNKSD